ncbi:MAG: alanine racemase [Gemmatimonadales bacterium]
MHDPSLSRREWLAAAGLTLAGPTFAPMPSAEPSSRRATEPPSRPAAEPSGFDPWLEIDSAALAHNASTVSRLAGGRPILAMVKNNAYGLGLATAGPLFDRLAPIGGFGVVRPSEAVVLREAGVAKPIVLMGPASDQEAELLVRQSTRLTLSAPSDADQMIRLARRLGRAIPVHLYADTGMHRMGLAYDQILTRLDSPLRQAIRIEGAMTELVEDEPFDREQSARLAALAETARRGGIELGRLHAASSDAILRPNPATFLDLVRPGLALYGGYPTPESRARGELRPAYRLKARVIRLDHLAAGEGVSYHHRYRAEQPTWIATLAIGHVDGYPAGAVKGGTVLVGDRLYPVIGTISASHTLIALGPEPRVAVGDVATLVGPDRPELHPNEVAARSGWSEYNMFMHLSPSLHRTVVS